MNLFIFSSPMARHYWVDNLNPWIVHFSGDLGI